MLFKSMTKNEQNFCFPASYGNATLVEPCLNVIGIIFLTSFHDNIRWKRRMFK